MQEFKQLIEESNRILVTSHISPDPDAVCSSLLFNETLKLNFPDKKVQLVLEEKPNRDISFLTGYTNISFKSLSNAVDEFKPDLVVLTDANTLARCTRSGANKIKDYVNSSNGSVKTVIIDHHEPQGKDESNIYLGSGSPACTQDIYQICFESLDLKEPDGYEVTALLGILADTARFKYADASYKDTFRITLALIEAGASIENLENKLNQISPGTMRVISELATNLSQENDYTYTFVGDNLTEEYLSKGNGLDDIKDATEVFTNDFLRNVAPNKWGFVVYSELVNGTKNYSVSLRSLRNVKDVASIAIKLGGGGHKSAAGAKIVASSVQEALNIVKSAV